MARVCTAAAAAVVLSVILSSSPPCQAADDSEMYVSQENRLYKSLLGEDYNKALRPIKEHNETVIINFGMALIHINNVDERHGSVNVQAWMRMLWRDHRFKWDPADWDGITNLRMPYDTVWRPDITLYNSASESKQIIDHTNMVVVYNTGEVLWIPPMIIHAKCDLDMSNFPFDTQSCPIKFGSWVYDGEKVDLKHYEGMDKIDFSDLNKHIEWEVKESPAKYTRKYYPCCEEPYPDITYTLVLKRRTTFYSYMYITPPLLISFLLPIIFLLPSLHASRHFLAVGIMIINCILSENVSWAFPTIDGTIPLLGRYYIGVFVLSFFALVISAIITSLAYRSRGGKHPPGFVKKVINDGLGRLLCVSAGGSSAAAADDESEDKLDAGGRSAGGTEVTEWLRLANVLDRLMILIYIILVLLIAFIYVAR